jgi:hypothetical protein
VEEEEEELAMAEKGLFCKLKFFFQKIWLLLKFMSLESNVFQFWVRKENIHRQIMHVGGEFVKYSFKIQKIPTGGGGGGWRGVEAKWKRRMEMKEKDECELWMMPKWDKKNCTMTRRH